jgi:hypothetical protein
MECICLLFLYIVNKQQWRHFGKGTQCGTMGNVDRSYFQQNELLIYFFSFL